MLNPNYLDQIPDSIVELYAQTEQTIINDMVRRYKKMLKITDTMVYQMERLKNIQSVQQFIIAEMSKQLELSQEELKQLFQDAGTETLKYDDKIYKSWGKNPIPLNQSTSLLQILNAGLKKTNGTFKNLTKTTANTATKLFENTLDVAYNEVISGAFTYDFSIKKAIKTLTAKGLPSIEYPSGHVDYIDVAVRRATLTGVNQTACTLQNERADQMESDLVETSSHAGSRPSHADWQGKVFSRSGKNKKYPHFETVTGYGTGAGLAGYNCRHSFYPCQEGDTTARTRAELEELNNRTVKYNGETISEYDARQKQRYIERQIRKYKRESSALETAGLDNSAIKAKISEWQAKQRDFVDQTGLKRDYRRERAGKQYNN